MGTRIQLHSLCNNERDMPPGLCGTVVGVDDQPSFTDLLWFREREYMEDHSQIILETPGGAREYRVIAVCQANSVESKLYQHINFTDSAGNPVFPYKMLLSTMT